MKNKWNSAILLALGALILIGIFVLIGTINWEKDETLKIGFIMTVKQMMVAGMVCTIKV